MSVLTKAKELYSRRFGPTELVPPDPDEISDKSGIDPEDELEVLERFESDCSGSRSHMADVHENYLQDKRMLELDDQWSDDSQARRNDEQTPRPMLVFNMIRKFKNQIVNPIRKNKPAIKVLPQGMGADQKSTEFRQGLIAGIERTSGAQNSYIHAFEEAVGCSFGVFRILPEWEADDSMNQRLCIEGVADASTVSWDSEAMKDDFSDALWYKIETSVSSDRLRILVGEFGEKKFKNSRMTSDSVAFWGDAKEPKITEYWYIEMKPEMLYELNELDENGIHKTAWESEKPSKASIFIKPDGTESKRESRRRCVYWCKLAGRRVISRVEWPGTRIPIYIVSGRRVYIGGRWYYWSLTRSQKSSNRAFNYAMTAQLERVATTTKAPWMVPEGGISTQDLAFWNTSASRNWPFLKYQTHNTKNQPIPPPFKTPPAGADPGITELIQLSQQMMKDTSGMFNPSVGQQEGDQSGKAIQLLQQQGDVSNFDFYDNLMTQIERCGDDLNELIPIYYNGVRQVLIVGKDDSPSLQWINKESQDEKGNAYHHKVEQGRYKSICEVGPSYKTKLLESSDALTSLLRSVPMIGQVAPDIIAKVIAAAQGWGDVGDLLSERLKKALPPTLQDQPKGAPQIPPQVIQALQQADQEHAAMSQQIQEMTQELQSLQAKSQTENRKIDVQEYDAITRRISALVSANITGLQAVLDAEQEVHMEGLQQNHERAMIQMKHMQDLQKQQQAQQAQAAQAQQQSPEGEQPPGPSEAANTENAPAQAETAEPATSETAA